MPNRSASINGSSIMLDARPDRLDLRDLPFQPQAVSLPPVYPPEADIHTYLNAYIDADLILDQGQDGACTGFGLAATINYLLWVRSGMTMTRNDRVSPWMLYHLARFYDEWPGENYEGSSCRGALKGWHKHGVCTLRHWTSLQPAQGQFSAAQKDWDLDAVKRPLGVYYRIDRRSVVDLQAAIRQSGAIYVSCNVHEGWDRKHLANRAQLPASHAGLPVISRQPGKDECLGVHSFALVGYNDNGLIVQNSWGKKWGASGFAVLPYDDWVDNGTDAWVVGMGVPIRQEVQGKLKGSALKSPKHFIRTADQEVARAGLAGWLGGNEPFANRKDIWSEGEAYPHTIVAGNDGMLINRLAQMPDAGTAAKYICYELPRICFAKQAKDVKPRIVVYAHGGLNDEADSITRIRVMGPYFRANNIYPVFVTWKSGWAETLSDMLADASQKELGARAPARGLGKVLNEAWDRAIEVIARGLLARSMWSQMKENVEQGESDGRDLSVIATHIADLYQAMDGNLEIHLVGHSAGAFVCGSLLALLQRLKKTENRDPALSVKSCTLYAPACDLDFANAHYAQAIADEMLLRDDLCIHVLSDERELDDTVGPYTKSLLYLVSRALERLHKTPLLGLAKAYDPSCGTAEFWNESLLQSVTDWQRFFWHKEARRIPVEKDLTARIGELFLHDEPQVNSGPCMVKATHGCFDNSIDVMESTLRRILNLRENEALPHAVDNLQY